MACDMWRRVPRGYVSCGSHPHAQAAKLAAREEGVYEVWSDAGKLIMLFGVRLEKIVVVEDEHDAELAMAGGR